MTLEYLNNPIRKLNSWMYLVMCESTKKFLQHQVKPSNKNMKEKKRKEKKRGVIRQEVKAKEYTIPMECVYIEKVSGKNVTDRPVANSLRS